MVAISAALVKQLREATNVSMMECKKALVETGGDLRKATTLLRERGVAVAAKRASRTANQGLIASAMTEDGATVSLIEVNCETDFVARNETFKAFVDALAQRACQTDESLAETVADEVTAKIAEIGENIIIRRHARFTVAASGKVASYIHLGGKVGVLVELGCEKADTALTPEFERLIRDLTLQVAASAPRYLKSDEIPAEELDAERDIYAKQVEGKPAQIVDKIVDGKIRKYFEEVCLVNQGFVKEPKQSIQDLLTEVGKSLGDTLSIRRFERYQLGV